MNEKSVCVQDLQQISDCYKKKLDALTEELEVCELLFKQYITSVLKIVVTTKNLKKYGNLEGRFYFLPLFAFTNDKLNSNFYHEDCYISNYPCDSLWHMLIYIDKNLDFKKEKFKINHMMNMIENVEAEYNKYKLEKHDFKHEWIVNYVKENKIYDGLTLKEGCGVTHFKTYCKGIFVFW